jgi:hypothetical protein
MAKKFSEYFNIREDNSDYSSMDNQLEPDDNSSATLHQAIDIAWKKDKPKIMAALRDISQQMEHGQLHLLLDKLDKVTMGSQNNENPQPKPPTSPDRYSPPVADSGYDGAVH